VCVCVCVYVCLGACVCAWMRVDSFGAPLCAVRVCVAFCVRARPVSAPPLPLHSRCLRPCCPPHVEVSWECISAWAWR
jgi:hypothetical protein